MNNKKLFCSDCLFISKAFDCVDNVCTCVDHVSNHICFKSGILFLGWIGNGLYAVFITFC